jgi:hypothetical protein
MTITGAAPASAVRGRFRTRVALCLATAASLLFAAPCAAQKARSNARSVTRDSVLLFVLDLSTYTVTVRDLLNGVVLTTTSVCPNATGGRLSDDDVSFVVSCGKDAPVAMNTGSFAVAPYVRVPAVLRRTPRPVRRNEVIVVGTIHAEHRTSTRYGLRALHDLLKATRPDFVLTEIPPNRFDAAMEEFQRTGSITEPRVARFPEYVDVLFPLMKEIPFTIIPTAGWTKPMDTYRNAALKRLAADSSRRAEWTAYQRASELADSLVAARGSDDPYFINSLAYDSIQTRAHEPYNRFFNRDLGPGGWDNINTTHFRNISAALNAHRGEGKRFVITYGAGHKEWFLRELRKRRDIVLLEVAPFLDQIGAKGPR